MSYPTGLILDDYIIHCDVPVWNWEDHGMTFAVGRGAYKRRKDISLIVNHWTGGERDADGLFDTLSRRNLGCDICIEPDGDVIQFTDAAVLATKCAGFINQDSISIEGVNYGFRRNPDKIPRKGRKREVYTDRVHGRPMRMAKFTPEQIVSFVAVNKALCSALDIPLQVPQYRGGLRRTLMSRRELREFSGCVGHFHVSKKKTDPGTDVLKALMAAGR